MAEKKKSEEEILFPEAKVEDLVIKPWSFGMLFEVAPHLEAILDKADEKNVMSKLADGSTPFPVFIARLFTLAQSEVLKVMALTLDMEEDEIKNFDMSKGIKIATIIYEQNKEQIKNALSPLLVIQEEIEEETKPIPSKKKEGKK